jgi:hypothetical protein
MPQRAVRLGIDFGTSHTVAVVRWPDGRTRPLLFDGSPLLPSAVFADPAGQLVVGRDAIHSGRFAPASFEPSPKRLIDDRDVLLGERVVTVQALVAAVFARVLAEYGRTVGAPPVDVVLTCPASWGPTRRLVVVDAARAAGLPEPRLVPEPVAAATYFVRALRRQVPPGSAVVVYDLGGGTFDASVVSALPNGFAVRAIEGYDQLGGRDLDELVLELIGAGCPPEQWRRLREPSTVEERRAAFAIRDEAREAKERLSRTASVPVAVPLLGLDVLVTRDELEQRSRELIDRTVRVTEGMIRGAGVSSNDLAGVFLVGGASRMPLVASALHRELGRPPVVIEQPELVVAEGSVLSGPAAAHPRAAPHRAAAPWPVRAPVFVQRPVPPRLPPVPNPVPEPEVPARSKPPWVVWIGAPLMALAGLGLLLVAVLAVSDAPDTLRRAERPALPVVFVVMAGLTVLFALWGAFLVRAAVRVFRGGRRNYVSTVVLCLLFLLIGVTGWRNLLIYSVVPAVLIPLISTPGARSWIRRRTY